MLCTQKKYIGNIEMNVNFGPGFGQPTAAQDFGMAAAGLGTGLGEART